MLFFPARFYHKFCENNGGRYAECGTGAMRLAQPHPDCEIIDAGEYIRARVGPGSVGEVHECYRSIATLALEHRFTRALVVGVASGDPVHHLAARDAVIALHVIGVPAGFRLAFVPQTTETLNAFRHAEIEGRDRGLHVKVFRDEAKALRWLTAPQLH